MPPEFRVTLDISADNESVVERWAVKFLADRGFNVVAPNANWETLAAFCKRVGITKWTLARRLRRSAERPNVVTQPGPSGKRTLAILSNPDFDAYCVRNK